MTELNERIGNDNWCVDRDGNVTRNGTRLCGPDGLDAYVPIVRRLLAAWWAAQPPCKDPVVGEWHGHLVSRCHRCGYPVQCGWPHRCKVAAPEAHARRCPTCDSPKPELHPAVQWEGEVHICSDSFHAPKPFTWPDAERIMLAGGECESRESVDDADWFRCRIHDGRRELLAKGEWSLDMYPKGWPSFAWRPCSAPPKYTWEQAEAGMRRGEIWVGKLPTWSDAHSFRFNENNWEYWFFEIKNPEGWSSFFRVDLLKQCEWRGKETTDET